MRQYDAAGNLLEFIRQPLYDSVSITTTAVEFRFFSTPRGQGGKTFWHTNMETSAQLAVPKSHLVDGIRFVPYGKTASANQLADMRELLYNQTWVKLTIGGLKDYLVVPTWYLPAGVGIPGFSDTGGLTTAATIQQVSNGSPIFGNYFSIRSHPILLPSQQTFGFSFNADAALASLSTATRCWVVLEGVNGRETM
jgi:hypothetical protein